MGISEMSEVGRGAGAVMMAVSDPRRSSPSGLTVYYIVMDAEASDDLSNFRDAILLLLLPLDPERLYLTSSHS